VDTVVFDKTGTLTEGHPQVAAVTLLTNSTTTREVLSLAAAVEQQATHPVAKALVAAAERTQAAAAAATATASAALSSSEVLGSVDQQQQQATTTSSGGHKGSTSSHHKHQKERYSVQQGSFTQEPGSGAVAVVDGKAVAVGTLEWVQRHGAVLTPQQEAQLQQHQAVVADAKPNSSSSSGRPGSQSSQQTDTFGNQPLTGHTQVYVAVEGTVTAVVDVADQIRPDAADAVAELQRRGVSVLMLSGDHPASAHAVAAAVGIPPESVHAGMKPAGKAAFVQQLKQSGKKVAMVGDGINDTAALAAADVGMAMAEGVDAASDVSKIVLMGGHLHQVVDALDLSQRTLDKIKQTLGWAFCYNLVGIPLAAGALLPSAGLALTPSLSGALMGFSSLAVMANSLLLQWDMRKVPPYAGLNKKAAPVAAAAPVPPATQAGAAGGRASRAGEGSEQGRAKGAAAAEAA
jgi:Cu2+-exporting ATPase